jgi:hypothetical protein
VGIQNIPASGFLEEDPLGVFLSQRAIPLVVDHLEVHETESQADEDEAEHGRQSEQAPQVVRPNLILHACGE